MIIIAMTGASGVRYCIELLKALNELNIKTGLLISDAAKTVLKFEVEMSFNEIINLADEYYDTNDLTASINSGSFNFDAMVVVPCSMKTLTAISHGYGNNAITRATDVALKEKRKLIIVPRETPLRTAHLENMYKISMEGGIILPAMPAFYHDPDSIDDIYKFIVGKILDSLNIENNLFKRWK